MIVNIYNVAENSKQIKRNDVIMSPAVTITDGNLTIIVHIIS